MVLLTPARSAIAAWVAPIERRIARIALPSRAWIHGPMMAGCAYRGRIGG
jgi:hypothetical protein